MNNLYNYVFFFSLAIITLFALVVVLGGLVFML